MLNESAFQVACIGVAVSATAGLGGLYLWRHSRERYLVYWSLAWVFVAARWAIHYTAETTHWLRVPEMAMLAGGTALVMMGIHEALPNKRIRTERLGLYLLGLDVFVLVAGLIAGIAVPALITVALLQVVATSVLLWVGWRATRQNGFLTLIVTAAAWLALNISGLLALGDAWRNSVLYPLIVLPMVVGFLMVAFERAHQRMVDAERKLDRIFHTAPVPLIVARYPHGQAEQFNQATLDLTGFTRDQLQERTGAEAGAVADRDAVRQLFAEARGGQPVIGREIWYEFPSGRHLLSINASSVQLEDGPRYILALHDLTRLREAEQAARASLEKFTALFEVNPVGIVVIDLQADRITEINDAALKLSGLDRELVFSRPPRELMRWIEGDAQRERAAVLRSGGRLTDAPGSFLRADGQLIHVLISGLSVMLERQMHLIITYRDVTRERAAEAAVQELNASLESRVAERTALLEQANRDLEGFSYTVAHDLRAPLRAITGFAKLLEEECAGALPDGGSDSLARISAAALRMSGLLDGLLEFARTGRTQIDLREVDMGLLVREVLAEMPELAQGRIKVCVGELPGRTQGGPPGAAGSSTLPPAIGDALLLRQVWRNLIENACKFSRGGPNAEIHIYAQAVPRLSQQAAGNSTAGNVLALRRGAGAGPVQTPNPLPPLVEYHVRDNGVGFEMKHAGRLFGVFQRLHNDPQYEGTGAGLAIVHRIISRHGGHIRAEAVPGHGATFIFSLGT